MPVDRLTDVRQHVPPVPPRNEASPAGSDEVALLRDELTDLKNQVRVLSDILDEIREELQWVTRNGLPIREPLPSVPVLKRMAADPCAEDWADRLVVEFGNPRQSPVSPGQASEPTIQRSSITNSLDGRASVETENQRRLF